MRSISLDAEEYFHLALHASSVNDTHACIEYLDEVLERQPANARALYLRAVQHAELGLTERAVSGIRAALAIEPALEIARFHLGLLLLFDRGRAQEAKHHLLELGGGRDRELRRYAEVLIALVDNDRAAPRARLDSALAETSSDQPLAAFMKRLLDHLSVGP